MQPLYMYIAIYMCLGCHWVESQGFRVFLQGIPNKGIRCNNLFQREVEEVGTVQLLLRLINE
jgi:hypothetical protein